ncbi:alpha/beta hydrolase family protein [Actinophytocola sp.]|jgi:dienelactone hydrolase|uniref:alpha/beta hydrolase family protein n=1 Tax=Actinophytocola sp. TaxID=1872138 RepID=UPI002EDA7A25
MTKTRRRALTVALLATLVATLLTTPARATEATRTYTGTIDGAEFRVEVPARWNHTLVLYSHPYYTPQVPGGIGHAGRAETQAWLLDHGYALAASDFKGRNGFVVQDALEDQVNLLDWVDRHVGRPHRTVATGSSMGAALAIMLAERNPGRIDGVAAMCGPLDLNGTWNVSLDITFALRTLLAPDAGIDLVRPRDAAASVGALDAAVGTAVDSPQGRARVALANSFGNVDGWGSAHQPKPPTVEGQVRAMAALDQLFFVGTFGPVGRVDLERRAGGNPSFNTGVDYRRQLARSTQRDLVVQAYRDAGLDLEADLDALAAAPRIAPDPKALAWMYRYAVPRGTTPSPVLTLHNIADGADPANERWYAGQVERRGDPGSLRQLWAGRATHCAFSAAEEIVAMRALFARVATGRWPSLDPAQLNAAAGRLAEPFQRVFDFATFTDLPRPPAFTEFSPGHQPRPSH